MNIKKVKNTFEKKSSQKSKKKKYSEPFRRRSNDLKRFDRQVPTTISNGHKMQISMEFQFFFHQNFVYLDFNIDLLFI